MSDIARALKDVYEPHYYPAGNTHEPEWQGNYLGVSSLVKQTATAYAKRILSHTSDDRDPQDAYWAFLGNALADTHLAPVTPYREVQFKVPLPEGWYLVGHADGVTLIDEHVIVNEAKAYATIDNEAKNDLAHRQAAMYAAMCREMLRNGGKILPYVFDVADFATDPTIQNLTLTPDYEVWGTCLHVSPRFGPPALVDPRYTPPRELDAIFDFYISKANAILQSVFDGNLDAARAWDTSPFGLTEFTRDLPQLFDAPDADALADYAIRKHAADETLKAATDEKKAAQAEALAIMRAANLEECTLPDGTVLKVNGGWQSASPWLRVKPAKEVTA